MKFILKYIKYLFLLILFSGTNGLFLYATHNRAGEITLKKISELTYEITITTYTYTLSGADRPELDVLWGDNQKSIAPRIEIENLANDYRKNVYRIQHTYPGYGTYSIVVQDPNRNFGVKNIPNSVNVIFSIKTIIIINPLIGPNSTPLLLNPPYDKAGLYQTFIHNPGAFDPDGDSISYSLSKCTQQNGDSIPGYTLPKSSDTLYVNQVTGDLIWDAPVEVGIYNIAINIIEWRGGYIISNIARDMQIEVFRTTNLAPINDSLPNLCVIAGTPINFDIRSKDTDSDKMTHFINGGPIIDKQNPASISIIKAIPGEIVTRFTWKPSCDQVRTQPYSILIKTTDNNSNLSMVDIDNLEINVLGPPPQNLYLVPAESLIHVHWKTSECENVIGYNIYRREKKSLFEPDSCTYGIPSSAGFELIGKTTSGNDSIYIDNHQGIGNNVLEGDGLPQGELYCYRVVAIYSNGTESIASEEVCGILKPGSPSILNASVTKIDNSAGEVFLSWAKPLQLDTIPANGPYEYIIYRFDDKTFLNPTEINRFNTSDLNDTVFYDKNLNTLQFPYSYSVKLYNDAPGNRFLIGKPEIASTMYPKIDSVADNTIKLKFIKNVPWINFEYIVYRYNKSLAVFDSIYTTEINTFSDTKLTNNEEYCYQISSKGKRTINGIEYFTENFSHMNCGIPKDIVPPGPPMLDVHSICDSSYNRLVWMDYPDSTSEDIVKYNIYYTPKYVIGLTLIDSVSNEYKYYNHFLNSCLDAACYFVTAVDSFSNESLPLTLTCVDECFYFEIPNVFSPNGDGINDILNPSLKESCIYKIDLKIFNRWGKLIFQTNVPEINWDGTIENSNQIASTGVYYYSCDIFKNPQSEPINLVGFIHVYSDNNSKNADR